MQDQERQRSLRGYSDYRQPRLLQGYEARGNPSVFQNGNRLLDRSLLIGTIENREIGYFSELALK